MQAQSWSNQRERRYQPSRDAARHIIEVLQRNLPVVRYHAGDTSIVATTYLDSADGFYLRSCNDHRSLKLRVREYLWRSTETGKIGYRNTCFIERKQRDGDVRSKQRVEVDKRNVMKYVLGDERLPGKSSEADTIRDELARFRVRPVMVSAYERVVFGDEIHLRVTYDERVSFHAAPRGSYNMAPAMTPDVLGEPLAGGPSRILEVKQQSGDASPAWLEQVLAQLTASPGYSKFRNGMQAIAESDGSPVNLTRRLTPLV